MGELNSWKREKGKWGLPWASGCKQYLTYQSYSQKKGVTQLEGQYLLYFLVLSFWILFIYKSRISLTLTLECFSGGRSSHAVGCGREKWGRTDTEASTAGIERLVKEAGCQLGVSQRQPFLGSGRTAWNFLHFRKLPRWLKQRLETEIAAAKTHLKFFLILVFLSCCNKGVERRSPCGWCLNLISLLV